MISLYITQKPSSLEITEMICKIPGSCDCGEPGVCIYNNGYLLRCLCNECKNIPILQAEMLGKHINRTSESFLFDIMNSIQSIVGTTIRKVSFNKLSHVHHDFVEISVDGDVVYIVDSLSYGSFSIVGARICSVEIDNSYSTIMHTDRGDVKVGALWSSRREKWQSLL